MAELFEVVKIWFFGLGERYGVNPLVFGSIYVGAIPFFTLSVAWLIRNYRRQKSIGLPAVSSVFFFISAYLYLAVAGKNIPWWVYGFIMLMVGYGIWITARRIRRKIENLDQDLSSDEYL